MRTCTKNILIISAATICLSQSTKASLVPGLLLQESGFGDLNLAASGGVANFDAAYGDYSLVITTGQTSVGGSEPILDLNIAVTWMGTGSAPALMISYSDGLFGPTDDPFLLSTVVGVGTTGTISSSAGFSSTPFGNATNLGGSSDVPGALVVNASGVIDQPSYYLTIQDTINGNIAGADGTLQVVPEPSTIASAALMFIPLGISAIRSLRGERRS